MSEFKDLYYAMCAKIVVNERIQNYMQELEEQNKEMLEALIDAYRGVIDEPSMLKSIIEKATGLKIEEILED